MLMSSLDSLGHTHLCAPFPSSSYHTSFFYITFHHEYLDDTDQYEQNPRRSYDNDVECCQKELPIVYPPNLKQLALDSCAKEYIFNSNYLDIIQEQGSAPNVDPQEQAERWINNTVREIISILTMGVPRDRIKRESHMVRLDATIGHVPDVWESIF